MFLNSKHLKEESIMAMVQPIRDIKDIENMKRVLKKSGQRDYMLFLTGINTGLRISDILKLKVSDVKGKSHISIKEKKTGKNKRLLLNAPFKVELDEYIADMQDDEPLFKSQKGDNKPIGVVRAWGLLQDAAEKCDLDEIGTHTLRKTFGYHFYQQYKDVALLQDIFNHSSPSVTLRYIGINADIVDTAISKFNL
jgi:integrase